jgi:DNA-binding CsgD family transcriptional regulator
VKNKGVGPFVGRRRERRILDQLVAGVGQGNGATLTLVGAPGIGKTSLLDQVMAGTPGLQSIRIAGVEPEMGLPFAALHRLLRPWLARIGNLPGPQRDALSAGFGLTGGGPADLDLTGLAVLALLTEAGHERPLLCVVDDAHWLDRESAEALVFVARRLAAEPVGLLFAQHPPAPDGLSALEMRGLPDENAGRLLSEAVPGRLDRVVAGTIVSGTGGNPGALIELARTLTPRQLSGAIPLPDPLPISPPVETHLRPLPAATRSLLLLISAAPQQNPALIRRVAQKATVPAQLSGILAPDLSFRDPLIRSAVYWGADAGERRQVHATLAAAYDPESEPELHARHLAQATIGLDEAVAAQLTRVATAARPSERVAFLARAAELSPDPGARATRSVAAAQAHLMLGDPTTAIALLDRADPYLDGPGPRVLAQQVRATAEMFSGRYDAAPVVLLEVVRATAGLDAQRARSMAFDALYGMLMADQHHRNHLLDLSGEPDPFLKGYATRAAGDHDSAVPLLRAALSADGPPLTDESLFTSVINLFTADEIWHEDAGRRAWSRLAAAQRDGGAIGPLHSTLLTGSVWELRSGRFTAAEALLNEAGHLGAVSETHYWSEFLAWSGREAEARAVTPTADFSLAVLEIALGRYPQALACLRPSFEQDRPGQGHRGLPDIVEAGVRSGDHAAAKNALVRMEERAPLSGTDWGMGLLARCRALMADDDQADLLYLESRDRLAGTGIVTELARSHLLYGEWLRRRMRRVDARNELRTALEMFTKMGAKAFADRARTELLATGERARRRTDQTAHDLTPQEKRVAHLAAAGFSNGEIAAQLVIGVSTVEHHLSKVFLKLAITSRRRIAAALAPSVTDP